MRPCRVVAVRLIGDLRKAEDILDQAAELGYSYGGITPLHKPSASGTYAHDFLVRLVPSDRRSEFRLHRIELRRQKQADALDEINSRATTEAAEGYGLVDVIPLNRFRDQEPGPVTVELTALFERQDEIR